MEVFAGFVVLASLLLGLFGLVNLVKPLGVAKITRRRHAAGVIAGAVFLLFAGGLLGAASQPGGLSAAADAPAVKGPADPEVKRAEAKPAGISQAEYDAYYQGVMVALGPCDTAVSTAAEAMQGGDILTAYSAAKHAEDTCLSTNTNVRAVKIPRSARGEVKDAFEEAREACEYVGTAKWAAMRQAAKVLDGDMRPSAVSRAKEDLEAIGPVTMRCVATVIGVGVKAGVQLPGDDEAAETTN